MTVSFRTPGTEDIYNGRNTRAARTTCPGEIWSIVRRKLDQINRARDLHDLSVPPGNRLERLRGRRKGQHSIRINSQYRICFKWESQNASEVEITDYH